MSRPAAGGNLRLLTPQVLHIMDRSLWMLPFATPTDLESAAKKVDVAVSTRNSFLAGLLAEHERDDAPGKLKDLWASWIRRKYPGTSDSAAGGGEGGPVLAGARAPTPP